MRKIYSGFLILCLVIFLFIGCAQKVEKPVVSKTSSTINIVATLFPQYDFAKQIVREKGTVTLLLPPGVESHSFEPKPSDIICINNADLFLFTGKYMEIWSQSIIEGMENPEITLDVSKGIEIRKNNNTAEEHHDEHDQMAEHYYDPHIWTSPVNAKIMVQNILDGVCRIDPKNAAYYRINAESYLSELDQLDSEFKSIVENGKRNKIIFGSKFAMQYFANEYHLDCEAAFDSCSAEAEPGTKTIAHLVDSIKAEKIPVIYYEEITEPKIARAISEETGAKMLLFHSCHNVTKEDFKQGVTYLSLMKQNAINLKEGLN